MAFANPASGEDEPHLAVARKGLLTVAIMTAMVMQILDTTIANVALPHMQSALGATQDTITWVLTSYILAAAVAIPITGWLSDRIGVRRLMLGSVALFTIASALCGIATSLTEMVIFRVFQGIGGAFLGPLAQSIMLDINRPSEQAKAMSVYGMGIMVGPIMGPIIGGYLTEAIDWRWCFIVNVPVGILCFAGLWLLLPEKRDPPRRFDIFGFSLLAIALASLQLMLDRGQHQDWFSSTEIWIECGVMIAAFWMFAVHLFTSPHPLFPPIMLRNRNLMTGTLFMFILGVVMFSAMALLPSLLQNLFGYPVVDTGLILSARGVGVLITMGLAGRLVGVVDARILVASGFAIAALSMWLMTGWSLGQNWVPFVTNGFIQGLGIGFVFVPLNVLSFATLPPSYRTEGAALLNLSRNIGSSVGIAVVTFMLARNIQVSHADLAPHISSSGLPLDPGLATSLGTAGDTLYSMADNIVNQQAAMIAYLDDFLLMCWAALAAIPLVLLLKKAAPPSANDDTPHISME